MRKSKHIPFSWRHFGFRPLAHMPNTAIQFYAVLAWKTLQRQESRLAQLKESVSWSGLSDQLKMISNIWLFMLAHWSHCISLGLLFRASKVSFLQAFCKEIEFPHFASQTRHISRLMFQYLFSDHRKKNVLWFPGLWQQFQYWERINSRVWLGLVIKSEKTTRQNMKVKSSDQSCEMNGMLIMTASMLKLPTPQWREIPEGFIFFTVKRKRKGVNRETVFFFGHVTEQNPK